MANSSPPQSPLQVTVSSPSRPQGGSLKGPMMSPPMTPPTPQIGVLVYTGSPSPTRASSVQRQTSGPPSPSQVETCVVTAPLVRPPAAQPGPLPPLQQLLADGRAAQVAPAVPQPLPQTLLVSTLSPAPHQAQQKVPTPPHPCSLPQTHIVHAATTPGSTISISGGSVRGQRNAGAVPASSSTTSALGSSAMAPRGRPSSTGAHRSAAFPGVSVLGRTNTQPQLGNVGSANQTRSVIVGHTTHRYGAATTSRASSRHGSRGGTPDSQRALRAGGRIASRASSNTSRVTSSSPVASRMSSRVSSPRGLTPRRGDAVATPQRASLNPIWTDLLARVEKWRYPSGEQRSQVDHHPPDPVRTRKVCQVLTSVVNQVQDEALRRVLTVLTEELFHSTFRDYTFTYDPREDAGQSSPRTCTSSPGSQHRRTASPPRRAPMPLLSQDLVQAAVPYFAVVQSLRDAAKDAIMKRLELEAKVSSEAGDAASEAKKRASEKMNKTAGEELSLREELRHARLLADTYQARALTLERSRLEMDEEVARYRHERQKDEIRRQKTDMEIRRLRAEVEAARAERVWYAETKSAAGAKEIAQQALRSPRSSPKTTDTRSRRRRKSSDAPEAGDGIGGSSPREEDELSCTWSGARPSRRLSSASTAMPGSATLGSSDLAGGTQSQRSSGGSRQGSAPTLSGPRPILVAPSNKGRSSLKSEDLKVSGSRVISVTSKATPKASPKTPTRSNSLNKSSPRGATIRG